jgi:hypothetical protein
MRTHGTVARTILVWSVIGCGSSRRAETDVVTADYGRYSFVAEASTDVRVTGVLLLAQDTIVPQPSGTMCRVAANQPSTDNLLYDCQIAGDAKFMLSIHRRNPLRRSMWVMVTPTRRTRQACIAWRTWENGTRTCTRSVPEEYIEQVRSTGNIIITR